MAAGNFGLSYDLFSQLDAAILKVLRGMGLPPRSAHAITEWELLPHGKIAPVGRLLPTPWISS